MSKLIELLSNLSLEFFPIVNNTVITDYVPVDLSIDNPDLNGVSISKIDECQAYIYKVINDTNAKVAYGGYLEKRNLYANNSKFSSDDVDVRNIHLGIDFWTEAGTKILTPFDGVVHSFQNNTSFGDYGPTIILEHNVNEIQFYTLYGHLSLESISDLHIGKQFNKGNILATLGTPDVNVGYVPHLHFQLINNIQDAFGDYPGVSSIKDLVFYTKNCPNPNILLGL